MRNMFKYILIILAIALGSVEASASDRYKPLLLKTASEQGVPYKLLYGICMVESSMRARAFNRLDWNAPSYGLGQIQLRTARGLGFQGNPRELFDPSVNLKYTAKYLRKWLDYFKGNVPRALNAYNSGNAKKRKRHFYWVKVVKASMDAS